ncbi:hypothetical protein C8F01DRAFT_369338 [Mycena amicta]|nr:hypothetical protein C8F01DRAFT_369338 [Mycena amicta]
MVGALHTLDRTSFKLKDIVKLMLSMSFFFRTSTKKLCLVIGSASGVPQDRHYPPLPTTAPGTRRRTQRRAPSSPTLSSLTRFEPIDKLQRLVSSSARMEVGPWDRKLVPLTPSLFATTSGGLSTALACIQASKRPCKRELGAAGIWIGKHLSFPIELTYLQNGWTRRCIGPEAAGQTLEFAANGELGSSTLLSDIWLSQAGHIFNSLNIRDNLDSYIIALPPWLEVAFTVPHGLPTCYLFLCPQRQASENKASKEDIAYWSLDQLGRHRLSLQEARLRGLPDLAISRRFGKYCWSQSVYEEIRATHIAKGFTPDSQAVAQLLGHPLFELVAERKGEYFAEAWAEDDWTLANLFHETDLRRCFEEDVFRRLSSAPAEVSEDQSSLALDEPKLQPRASNWPRLPSVRMVEAVMVVLSVLVVGIELSR